MLRDVLRKVKVLLKMTPSTISPTSVGPEDYSLQQSQTLVFADDTLTLVHLAFFTDLHLL